MRASLRALTLPFLLICLLALAIGISTYAARASADRDAVSGYASYHNDRWHFSLAVPEGMRVETYDQPPGAETMQFIDRNGDYQFEVSASPYSQFDVTLDRSGEASNAGDQPDHLEIVNVQHDDVFKVWFTKNGTLYVVTALREYESELTNLLKSWQFN